MNIKELRWLFFIMILVIVVRVVFFLVLVPYNPKPQVRDEYLAIARNVVDSKGFSRIRSDEVVVPTSQRVPVPVYFFAATLWLFGDNTLSIALANWIVDAITGVILFLIALEFFGSRSIALTTALLFALYPAEMYYSWQAISEPLFGLLLSMFVLSFLRTVRSPSATYCIITGILLGLTALTRPILLYYLPVAIVLFFWLQHRQQANKRIINWAAIFSFSCIIVVLPWGIRNYLVFDRVILGSSNTGITLFHGSYALGEPDYLRTRTSREGTDTFNALISHNKTLTQPEYDELAKDEAITIIKKYPVRFGVLSAIRFFKMWYFIEGPNAPLSYLALFFHLPLLALTIIAFVFYRGEWWRPAMLLVTLIIFNNLGYAVMRTNVRYIVPVVPYVMLFAAVTIVNILFRVRDLYRINFFESKGEA